MKKQLRIVFLLSSLIGVFCLSGCSTTLRNPNTGNKGSNVLGIVQLEKGSFAVPRSNSINVSRTEVCNEGKLTGKKITLLWGAFTFMDY